MIKVLELCDDPFIGGGQTHIISICESLDRSQFEFIIAGNPKGGFKELVEGLSFPFRSLYLPVLYRKKYLRDLLRIITEEKIDIIHSHGRIAGMYSRIAKKKNHELKVIQSIHGIHYIHRSFIYRNLSLLLEKYLVKFTDAFIVTSATDLKKTLKLKVVNKNRTELIYNGIDLKKFNVLPDPEIKQRLGIGKDDFIIGNISRFDYQKNQRYLIKVFSQLVNKYPELKLLLVGEGSYKEECEKLAEDHNISDKIIFTGMVNDPQNYYPLIDLYVFPTLWEGFSIMLIEAMASGRSIVASALEENIELIKDMHNGLTFDLNNENFLIEKIETLMKSHELRKNISKKALKDSERYSKQAMTRKVEDLYRKVTR